MCPGPAVISSRRDHVVERPISEEMASTHFTVSSPSLARASCAHQRARQGAPRDCECRRVMSSLRRKSALLENVFR